MEPGKHIVRVLEKLIILLPLSILVGTAIGLVSAFITKQCPLKAMAR